MQRAKPINNEIYHVLNRGTDKRKIFLCDEDYLRFIHDIFEFNDEKGVTPNTGYFFNRRNNTMEVGLPYIRQNKKPRKFLVEILAFCLMPNHFHLMLRQKVDGGITKFMRKLGTGYTNYFNQKYKRSGALFQGKYKIGHITDEAHFIHLPYYIHFNPLDLIAPEWRERELKNYDVAINFLEKYRWSSHLDYLGKKNFPSVTQREFLTKFFEGPQQYKKDSINWLKEISLEEMQHVSLEQ